MNPTPAYGVAPHYVNRFSKVSVRGFCNTVNKVGTGITLNYGSHPNPLDPAVDIGVPMNELTMLKPYQDTGLNLTTDNYTIEGREIMPSSASCKWRLCRNISSQIIQLTAEHPEEPQLAIPATLATNLPVICRMIRVVPKLTQTDQVCDPEVDLFMSPFTANSTGVFKSDFDDLEMLTYPVNKRRYNVLEDKFFRIQNGLTITYQKSTRGASDTPGLDDAFFQPQISNTNANCEKVLTTRHQLSSKKGGKIFYNEPVGNSDTVNATTGNRKEYILWHYIYAGAESYLNDANTTVKCPRDLLMSAVPSVKFSDV